MPKEINIILDKSTHAQPFEANSNLIHQDELENVLGFIKSKIENVNENISSKNKPELHLHDTITILGSRGSGKTSFLLSVQKELEKKNKFGDINSSDFQQVQVLEIIDPTLIEEKGHVFLNVISRITELVEKKLDDEECKPTSDQIVWKRKDWRNALSKLASGLPSIDGVADHINNSWQDPEFVMENGLKSVGASLKLSENFHNLLIEALKILDKKVFLLMFDDIDVDSRKGWPVLETIRKYLTSDRLITILSGDMKLYSTVVRQKKWQNFGKDILNYEGDVLKRPSRFDEMVTELEAQYLKKVMLPKYRIHLPTIWKVLKRGHTINVYKKNTDNEIEVDIRKVYKKILSNIGLLVRNDSDQYLHFFLDLPIRTQVQVLSIFFEVKTTLENQIDSLIDVFISDLYAKEIDAPSLRESSYNINRIILQFLLKEQKIEELYQLQPFTTDSSLNSSLINLNFILATEIKANSYLIFDYIIRIGYIRNLVPLIGYKAGDRSEMEKAFEEMCRRDVILNDSALKTTMGRIIAYLRGQMDNLGNSDSISRAGTIPLFGMAGKAKKKKEETQGRIDWELTENKANYIEKLLVYLPLSSNQYVYKQSSLLTYSPYLLIAAIGELCRMVQSGDSIKSFAGLTQLRAFIMPHFKTGNNKKIDVWDAYEQDLGERLETDINIEYLVEKWIFLFKQNYINISVQLLGRVSTRFFYVVTNIESEKEIKSLGEIFHSHIIGFMNSVLVEDFKEQSDFADELSLSNPRYSDVIFTNNLKKARAKLNESDLNLSFSKWILACPLLLVYLKNQSDLINLILEFSGYEINSAIFNLRVYDILNKVKIKKDIVKIPLTSPNHEKIVQILEENDEDIDNIKTFSREAAKTYLSNFGIIRVTENSWNSFLTYLEKI
ncbi:hypothetical protein [Emticicia sp. 21SJ11W-3]|uniref:hypothetical protein n=1 Tax=Emticicia sp. 21SJ11W-3 TaxID=2916755 RepID=UPI0020A083F0|nr:hypothetical protein [Emticicia sp. 21SJ11W-3]UTA66403.1 hypothetical protein MB380_12415 [Emticicia sp. 21SJ11W-3]